MSPLERDRIAWAVQMACLFEANAEKPGNVTKTKGFSDARFEDFLASAVAVGPAFREVSHTTVGETVLRAIRDTRRMVRTNTNLGIVLLLAPLAKAATCGRPGGLRSAVAHVLRELSAEDACNAYEAIRLAAPAGLGQVERHDVSESEVQTTLLEAMGLAQARDSVAREYVTDFEITFGLGYPTLRRLWDEGHSFSGAIVQTFLTLLAKVPDTLIARKRGWEVARRVSRRAGEVLAEGGLLSDRGREEILRLDLDLRDEGHGLNPGTTADLVSASLFVFLMEGEMLERVPELLGRW